MEEALEKWKRQLILRRIPNGLGIMVLVAFTWYGWGSASTTTRIVAILFNLGFLVDTVQIAWKEWGDPAFGTISDGVLRIYWISERKLEVPLSRVSRVTVHESLYWHIRRVYPKWFELEIEGEPKRIVVPALNLKPDAREVLSRMSR